MVKKDSQIIVYLSLGSNIGDRVAYLAKAEEKLQKNGIKIVKKSSIYETEPWSLIDINNGDDHPKAEKGQMWFLNQVIQIQTDLSPQELLSMTQAIEKEMGRTAKHHWGPREIDIDILLYDNQVVESPELAIPHRHMNDRQFVLVPLIEIEPNIKDPVSGKTFKSILKNIKDKNKVETYF